MTVPDGSVPRDCPADARREGIAPTELSTRAASSERTIRALALTIAGLLLAAIVFPRFAATAFLLPIGGLLLMTILLGRGRDVRITVSALIVAMVAFASWSLATSLWSAAPLSSISKPLFLLGGALGLGVVSAEVGRTSAERLRLLVAAALAGIAVGALFQSIETLTDQSITRAIMNWFPAFRDGQSKHIVMDGQTVVGLTETNINRRAAIVTLLLVPSALVASVLWTGVARAIAFAAIIAVALAHLGWSGHQSSQISIILAAVALGLATLSLKWSVRALAVGWLCATLLVVPIALGLHAAGFHKRDSGLFNSARHRVLIWNHTAEQVLKSPWLGVGADATPVAVKEQAQAWDDASKRDSEHSKVARHAHNAFLQVWYELGAVGAVIFAWIGLAALAIIARATPAIQPYLLAQFAVIAGMIGFSYSIWQLWFQGAIGLSIAGVMLGHKLLTKEPRAAAPNTQHIPLSQK
jgi:O-antigen ligase